MTLRVPWFGKQLFAHIKWLVTSPRERVRRIEWEINFGVCDGRAS